VVDTVDALEDMLRAADDFGRRSEMPQAVALDRGEAGTLTIVVGADRSVLTQGAVRGNRRPR